MKNKRFLTHIPNYLLIINYQKN